jgi:hypothetical protein
MQHEVDEHEMHRQMYGKYKRKPKEKTTRKGVYFLPAFSADLLTLALYRETILKPAWLFFHPWRLLSQPTFLVSARPYKKDRKLTLMTPTATVCLMSRTANRPRGG